MADVDGSVVSSLGPAGASDGIYELTAADGTLVRLGASEPSPVLPVLALNHKAQFVSAEVLSIVLNPFISTTGQYVTGGADVVTIVAKAPDNTIVNPTAVYDSDTDQWVASIPVVSFQEGEWLVYAISNIAETLPQFLSLWWGDYMDDIPEARQAAVGRWKIDGTVLSLYEDDGLTVFKTFDLKDSGGLPSSTAIFDKDPA